MNKKRIISIVLILCTLIGIFSIRESIKATSAEKKKEEAEEDLQDVENEIEDIENQQQQVEDEITKVKKELTALFAKQEALEGEIEETQIAIEQTQMDLEVARKEADKQYEAMKVRIQYMYENSTEDSLWEAIIGAKGISDLLNRVEYISMVYQADRDLTEQYKAAVAVVEEKEAKLQTEMENLLVKQEIFLGQQADIEEMVAQLEGEQAQFAQQLASAQEQARKYEQIIAEQDEIIRKEEEARRAEEERRRKEEEERKRKEEEEKRKQEEEEKRKEEENKKEENNNNTNNDTNNDTDNESNSGVSGTQLVNYALQFVGNPYVWGGNSLTNGCDCSGFVHLVYKHFGYTLPRYSMSFLNVGTPVSLSEIKVGDIVVYTKKGGVGHVAIYIGNGKIVEAQSSKAGITANRAVDCREIAGIRRVLD
uniref:C40 family peptidase n=1 Tax=Agathobacter sp. TaxID=2021311 RepID=UPI004055F08D